MTAFTKFNPLAFRREPGPEPAKLANPAKAKARSGHPSDFSSFSGQLAAPADQTANTTAPLAEFRSGEWATEDWLAFFDERAGIAEFDGHLTLEEAEERAFSCCIAEWLCQHPAPSPPGRCAWCGAENVSGAAVLPFGILPETHTWLHPECWPAWRNSREAGAALALAAMGVRGPGTHR